MSTEQSTDQPEDEKKMMDPLDNKDKMRGLLSDAMMNQTDSGSAIMDPTVDNRDTVDMFTSVWVKVEVMDDEQENEPGDDESKPAFDIGPSFSEYHLVPPKQEMEKKFRPKKQRTKMLSRVTKYKCNQCSYASMYSHCLKIHLASHLQIKPFHCRSCDYSTKYKTALKRHCNNKHGEKISEKEITETYEVPIKHEENSDHKPVLAGAHTSQPKIPSKYRCRPSKLLQCNVCSYSTVYKHCLKIHLASHQAIKPFKCKSCDYSTKYKTALKRHIGIRHSEKRRVSVDVKVEIINDDDLSTSFGEPQGEHLQNKTIRKKYPPTKQLHCSQCSYTTLYKHCLNIHLNSHFEHKPYQCPSCEYSTKYKTSLYRHNNMKHSEKSSDNGRALKCNICEYVSPCKWNLRAHNRKHKLEKLFKCQLCDFKTSYKHNFVKHSNIHKRANQVFRCAKCPFQTIFEGRYQRHLSNIHNEITPSSSLHTVFCEYCAFSTKDKWRMRIHMKRSNKGKMLKCNSCEFSTEFNCFMRHHKKLHHQSTLFIEDRSSHLGEQMDGMMESSVHFKSDAADSPTDLYDEEIDKEDTADDTKHLTIDDSLVLESNDEAKPFQCSSCPYISKFKVSVQKHFLKQHVSNQLQHKCSYCDFSTKLKWKMNVHKNRSRTDIEIKCTSCEFATQFSCEMKHHRKVEHANEILSVDAPRCSHLHEELQRLLEENDRLLKTQAAKEAPPQSDNSDAHEEIVDKSGDTKYVLSEDCFDWKSILVLKSTDEEKPFQCPLCPYTSKFKASVRRHFQRLHLSSNNRPFKCCRCDFSTKTKEQISLHNKRSKSADPVICRKCNFQTNYKCELIQHQRAHNSFRCFTCNYSCRHRHELTRHFVLSHIANTKCPYCECNESAMSSEVDIDINSN